MNRTLRWWVGCLFVALLAVVPRATVTAEALDYSLPDPDLKLIRIDSDPSESFLSVRDDTAGRLFVGGREALFVYEPDDKGGYKPKRLLYRFPKDTWVYDIAIRGDDLYVMTVSALYVIPGGVTKREGLQPRRLIWGVPHAHVHQCFHALAWGPEGDLYFSMGDPVWFYGDYNRPDHWGHWTFFTQPEGARVPYTGVGGVFRCRPDGSNFQVVARGLRNPCGLAFDRHWNLFSNDNDHEQMPAEYVPGRMIHVTPHADFSWPRGWMVFKTPKRADLLETMFDGMGRAVPVGQAYYDETFLPEKYRNNLLVARWGIRAVTRYPLEPRGASFKVDEQFLLTGQNQARPVGVSVGRGGRVFVTIAYMAHNDTSPIYKSDLVMVTRGDDPPAHPFDAYEATSAPAEKLWAELSDPSWGRRSRAHVEILRRGGSLLSEATRRLATTRAGDPAMDHLIWLSAAGRSAEAGALLVRLAGDENANVRLQAVRALAEFPELRAPRELFTKALSDSNPQVVLAAVLAFFNLPGDAPEGVIGGPACSKDTYLRQAATLLLAEKASPDRLAAMCRGKEAALRLAGVLAVGFRLTVPPATKPVADNLPLAAFPWPEAYVIQFADAKVDLREHGRVGNFTVADHWKAGPHSAEQERLFALLKESLDDRDDQVRLQAAHFLFLLKDPRSEPLVAKVRVQSEENRLANAPMKSVGKVWLAGPFPDGAEGLAKVHPPEQGPIDLSAEYAAGAAKVTWQEMAEGYYFDFSKKFGPCDASSFYAYCRLESPDRERILLLVGSDDGVKIWHNGREVWANPVIRSALPFQDVVVLDLQPGGNDLLVRVQNATGDCGMYLDYRAAGNVVVQLPEKLGIATLAERLKTAGGPNQGQVPAEFLKIDWEKAVAQGDAKKGRQLFGAIGCAKCHAITPDAQVVGGPSLADGRKRFTVPYVVESILLPSKQVSPIFRATRVETKAGQVVSGLVVGETADQVEMLLSDTTRKTIAKGDIESRTVLDLSPMPQGIVKTPEELRDLLAYLLSDKPQPP